MRLRIEKAMFVLFQIFSFVQFVCASESLALEKTPGFSTRVVGGVKAAVGEFPFIVSLQMGTRGHFCGGSLIGPKWVLTAAHCVKGMGSLSKLKLVLGLYQQSKTEKVEVFGAKRVIIHPEYQSKTDSDFDFALVELNKNSRFAPVVLNREEIDIPDLEAQAPLVTTAGWGTTREGGNVSDTLLKADLPLVSAKNCDSAYPKEITDRMICAGYEKGGKDSCQGDSGGPLLSSVGKVRTLVGVVSWGEGCARAGKYGVYSKVNSVSHWIENELVKYK